MKRYLMSCLAGLGLCLGATGGLSAEIPQILTSKSTFSIPFRHDPSALQALNAQEIQLYLSRDGGSSWKQIRRAPLGQNEFSFQVETDGAHWFSVAVQDATGKLHPNPQQTGPGLQVVVDRVPPSLSLQLKQNQDTAQLEWQASDPHLDLSTLRLEYRNQPTEPWKPVYITARENGRTSWKISPGQTPEVKGSVSDLAGNQCEQITSLQKPLSVTTQAAIQPVSTETIPAEPPTQNPSTAKANWSTTSITPASRSQERVTASHQAPTRVEPSSSQKSLEMQIVPATVSAIRVSELKTSLISAEVEQNLLMVPPAQDRPRPTPQSQPLLAAPASPTPALSLPNLPAQTSTTLAPLTLTAPTIPDSNSSMFPAFDAEEPTLQKSASAVEQVETAARTRAANKNWAIANAPRSLPAARSYQGQTSHVRAFEFLVEYQVSGLGPSGIGEVELFITQDYGTQWWRYGIDPDRTSPMTVKVPADGHYGLHFRIHSGVGNADVPPQPGQPPQVNVIVDSTAPQLELTDMIQGHGGQIRNATLRWNYSDANPAEKPITLFLSDTPQGPWRTLAGPIENTGEYTFSVPLTSPSRLFVKICGVDLVGNQTEVVSSKPLLIDLAKPTARILTIDGIR